MPEGAQQTDPVLVQIDRLLADDPLVQRVKADLARRYPQTTRHGRRSRPVEVILRMLVVKRLSDWSYEETEKRVAASLVLRWCCRVSVHRVPDDTTTHSYDPSTHDLVATGQPEGGITKYSYDGHHSVVATTEQTTPQTCATTCATTWQGTLTQYDQYGERTSTTDGRGVSVDANGTATLNDPNGQYTRRMGYDVQGDLTTESTPPLTTTLNGYTGTAPVVTLDAYDADGNRTAQVSGNHAGTLSSYDHLGRVVRTTLPAVGLATAPLTTTATVAINAGGGAVGAYAADSGYSGGNVYNTGTATVDTSGVANPAPQGVYQVERWGEFGYTMGGLTPGGSYRVRLHVAEVWFSAPGQRVFNVALNGMPVLTNFDIVAAAGGPDKAIVEEFPATADGGGQIALGFTSVVDHAKISGIEVLAAPAIQETTGYDRNGNVASSTDANGHTTTSSYDPLGRLVAETNPVSGTTLMTYTADELTAQQDPQGNVTGYGYDTAGRQVQATDPATGTVQTAYDAAGNTLALTTTDRTAGNTVVTLNQMGYDALNRVITGTVVTDTATIAGSTLTTLTRYDQDGNVAQTQQPNGDVVYNVYDAADRLTNVEIDPAPLTKAQAATHPSYEAYGYDGAGNQTVAQDADNRTTTTQYDGDNRATQSVAASTAPTGTTTITTTTQYDPNGNSVAQTTQTVDSTNPGQVQTHTTTSAYNAADWETSSAVDGLTTSYSYDAAGQQIGTTTSDGQTATTMAYDPAGRVTSIAEAAGGAGPYTTAYTYTADDLLQTVAYPNGTSEGLGYDANSQLTSLSATGPNQVPATTTLSSAYAYGYNAAGWITSTTTLSGTDAITHDASGRLTDDCGPQVTTSTKCNHWTYDNNGNLLTAGDDAGATDVYTYSAPGPGSQLNEQMAGGSSTSPPTATIQLAYDAHGNTTSIFNAVSQTPTDPGYNKYALAESFSYDAQQRPITVTRLVADKVNGQTLVTPITATIQYNADGLRADYLLTPDPRTGKTAVDTHFAYRDGQLASATVTDITGTLLGCAPGLILLANCSPARPDPSGSVACHALLSAGLSDIEIRHQYRDCAGPRRSPAAAGPRHTVAARGTTPGACVS